MPWYYAGPEAKPVGPVSLEEIHARRQKRPDHARDLRHRTERPPGRHADLAALPRNVSGGFRHASFTPASSATRCLLPRLRPCRRSNPLFPLRAARAASGLRSANHPRPRPPHGHYPARRTNACCAWGFGLGIASFILCGSGLILGLPALVICISWFRPGSAAPRSIGSRAGCGRRRARAFGDGAFDHSSFLRDSRRHQGTRTSGRAAKFGASMALVCETAPGAKSPFARNVHARADHRADLRVCRRFGFSFRGRSASPCRSIPSVCSIKPRDFIAPGCGATRALYALLHGRPSRSPA